MKTYWPYLPMLAIMGAGAVLDRTWKPGSVNEQSGTSALAAFHGSSAGLPHATTRLDVLTGGHVSWLGSLVLLVALAALTLFMVRNSLRFQRAVVKSEHFISSHPMLDIAAVFVFTAGFVLTRQTI